MLTPVSFFKFNQTFAVFSSIGSILFAIIKRENEQNTAWCGHGFMDNFISVCGNALTFYNEIPLIDKDLFLP